MARYTLTNPPTKALEVGDKVIFEVNGTEMPHTLKLHPDSSRGLYLDHDRGTNREVFTALGLNAEDTCRSIYGYHNPGGSWPEANRDDFGAVTRLVWHLFGLIATGTGKPKATKLSADSYSDGKIKVYTEEERGEIRLMVENRTDSPVCIATITTKDSKDGKAYLKLAQLSDEQIKRNGLAAAVTGKTVALQS